LSSTSIATLLSPPSPTPLPGIITLPPGNYHSYLGLAYSSTTSTLYATTGTSIIAISHANTTTPGDNTTTTITTLVTSYHNITISGYNFGDSQDDLMSITIIPPTTATTNTTTTTTTTIPCDSPHYYNPTTIGCFSGHPLLPSPLLPSQVIVTIRNRGSSKASGGGSSSSSTTITTTTTTTTATSPTTMSSKIRYLEGYRSPLVTMVVVEDKGFTPQALAVRRRNDRWWWW